MGRIGLRFLFVKKYNCTSDAELRTLKGPFLVISNHVTNYDPFFICDAFHEQLSYVASEHILQKGFLSRLMMWLVDVIPITKGKTALKTTRAMVDRLKSGTSVVVFPEGNRTFNGITMPVDSSCGKIAKLAGVPLVITRFEGGYFTQPRWSKTKRKGKIHLYLSKVYSPEEIKGMSDEELSKAINDGIYENAFETQKRLHIPFVGEDLAYGMESTLFMCPSCGKVGTMHTDSNHIFCSDCGFKAEYNEYGELIGDEKCPKDIAAWDVWQKQKLLETGIKEFDDDVEIFEVDENHEQKKIYEGKFKVPDDIEGVAVYARNVLVIHAGGRHLEVKGNDSFSALKYYYIFS